MCNGATLQDRLSRIHRQILDRGFTIMQVEGTPASDEWAYTIGLLNGHNHPELVVAGYPLEEASVVLLGLATEVVNGDRLDTPGDRLALDGVEFGVVPVDKQLLKGDLLAAWYGYHKTFGPSDLVPRALQVLLPDAHYCFHHQNTQPRLDQPGSFSGMNHRERRRQAFGRGRRNQR
jgi:hypothetical protein